MRFSTVSDGRVMAIIIIEEILMANGLAVLMAGYLLHCRRKNRESLHTEDKIYDGIALVNILGALSETVAFLIDGKSFIGSRQINYAVNSLCFIGTVSMSLLWCLYVELRIYRNYKRIFSKIAFLIFPWLVEVIMILCNLFRPGIVFRISGANVYQRAGGSLACYISVIMYFGYSIYLVCHSRKQGINLSYFPVMYFVGISFAGVILQLFFYGITASWLLAAVTLIFVQMQLYAENLYTDELSGLYNRRYLNAVLAKRKTAGWKSLHGIMMDINDFKHISMTAWDIASGTRLSVRWEVYFSDPYRIQEWRSGMQGMSLLCFWQVLIQSAFWLQWMRSMIIFRSLTAQGQNRSA